MVSQQPNSQKVFQYPPDQLTTLSQAFRSMSLQDLGNTDWYMDTGATAHLHADPGSLKFLINKCKNSNSNIYVLVGNGS